MMVRNVLLGCTMALAAGCATGPTRGHEPDGTTWHRDGRVWDAGVGRDAWRPGDGSAGWDASWDGGSRQDGTVYLDAQDCSGGCQDPPGSCYETAGHCVGGQCQYDVKTSGASCNDGDSCTDHDECDGHGVCSGVTKDCSRDRAHGGSCSGGVCSGWTCDSGWGNCNSTWDDGCETQVNTTQHCGSCSNSCGSRAHATASCPSGTCQYSCQSPYENCNGNWSDGCEIPTGVANQCDSAGLNDQSGCGTAWCGTDGSDPSHIHNFGTWHCTVCSNCHDFSGTNCSWCNISAGQWYYPNGTDCSQSGDCGSYRDTVCQ